MVTEFSNEERNGVRIQVQAAVSLRLWEAHLSSAMNMYAAIMKTRLQRRLSWSASANNFL